MQDGHDDRANAERQRDVAYVPQFGSITNSGLDGVHLPRVGRAYPTELERLAPRSCPGCRFFFVDQLAVQAIHTLQFEKRKVADPASGVRQWQEAK